jgi:hypothetical protein
MWLGHRRSRFRTVYSFLSTNCATLTISMSNSNHKGSRDGQTRHGDSDGFVDREGFCALKLSHPILGGERTSFQSAFSHFEMPIWHPKTVSQRQIPSGQYVDKNNCTLRVRDGNEWERTGKPLRSLGGCNFRKGNYLRFCRESVSQCGGQEFDPPLLHQ